jgi:hypothetical protein
MSLFLIVHVIDQNRSVDEEGEMTIEELRRRWPG